LMKLVFEYMNKNPGNRTAIDVAARFPHIENELIPSYVYRWYRLHPDLRMGKGAMGIAKLRNWTEEELEYLRRHKYGKYCIIMKRLERNPKLKKDQPTMDYFENIKARLSEQERKKYTPKEALNISINNAIMLLKKVTKSFPEIDFQKTEVMVIELKKRVAKLGKDRPATTIVGTSIYLANESISTFRVNKIMGMFGKCSRASIRQLCEILKVKKRVTEDVEISLKLLKKVSDKYPEIDYIDTEKVVKKIKKKLRNMEIDRPTSTVVGTGIYFTNKGMTQARVNKIMTDITNCKPINLTRLSKILKL